MVAGDLLILQDASTRPAKLIHPATGAVTEVASITERSENGVFADNGYLFFTDKLANVPYIYDETQILVATVSGATITQFAGGQGNPPVAYDGTYFYTAQYQTTGPVAIVVTRISTSNGSVVQQWTIPLPGGWGHVYEIAVSRDGSTLYYAAAVTNAPIKRWNLLSNSAMADFYTPPSGYMIWEDVHVLSDGTVVFGIANATPFTDYKILRYDAGGSLQNTYALSDPFGGISTGQWFLDHFTPADPHASSLWMWFQQLNIGHRDFILRKIAVSTGTTQEQLSVPDQAVDDSNGVPNSCPLLAFGVATPPPKDLSEPCCCDCPPPAETSRTPAAKRTAVGPILEQQEPETWDRFCSGNGVVPSHADATDPESWATQ